MPTTIEFVLSGAAFLLFLVILVKGSDLFVKYAADIAKRLGISEFIIGLTLVAIGTSLPELASSTTASIQHESGLVVGNIMGSNVANIGLIIGIAATIHYIKTKEVMLKRDGYFLLFCSFAFYVMVVILSYTADFHPAINAVVARVEGVILLITYIVYILFLIHYRHKISNIPHFGDFVKYMLGFKYVDTVKGLVKPSTSETEFDARKRLLDNYPKAAMARDIVIIAISIAMVIGGAYVVINRAVFFADQFDVPKTLVGFTLIAVGTSLPELSVCIAAARKGYGEIVLGNVIGSNITNILLVGGVASLIYPMATDATTILFIGPAMMVLSIILLIFVRSGWKLERWEGLVFLAAYFLFMAFIFGYAFLV
jgi:cation:H+ antiporter